MNVEKVWAGRRQHLLHAGTETRVPGCSVSSSLRGTLRKKTAQRVTGSARWGTGSQHTAEERRAGGGGMTQRGTLGDVATDARSSTADFCPCPSLVLGGLLSGRRTQHLREESYKMQDRGNTVKGVFRVSADVFLSSETPAPVCSQLQLKQGPG